MRDPKPTDNTAKKPSLNNLIWYVLDAAAPDSASWKEGYDVFTKSIMEPFMESWPNNAAVLDAVVTKATEAAITAAVKGLSDPSEPITQAWERFDAYMYGDQSFKARARAKYEAAKQAFTAAAKN